LVQEVAFAGTVINLKIRKRHKKYTQDIEQHVYYIIIHWFGVVVPFKGLLVTIRAICDVQPLRAETHLLGLDIAERYGFSFYDSLIVNVALLYDCKTLFSEDMQHGQKIENRMVIYNPFLVKI